MKQFYLYLWGSLSGGASPSFLRKIGRDNSAVWGNTISTQLSWTGFDVDYTETYLYAIIGTTSGGIIRFKTVDGSYDTSKISASFDNSDTSTIYTVAASTTSQTVFFLLEMELLRTIYEGGKIRAQTSIEYMILIPIHLAQYILLALTSYMLLY